MAEYIEREILLKRNFYTENCNSEENRWNDYAIKDIIMHIPAADVAPVKHGEWRFWEINKQISYDIIRPYRYYSCSICNRRSAIRSNYCPNCGAKMDGGENNGSR